jgi:hypothetical protein
MADRLFEKTCGVVSGRHIVVERPEFNGVESLKTGVGFGKAPTQQCFGGMCHSRLGSIVSNAQRQAAPCTASAAALNRPNGRGFNGVFRNALARRRWPKQWLRAG